MPYDSTANASRGVAPYGDAASSKTTASILKLLTRLQNQKTLKIANKNTIINIKGG
jgi:hypothetical protein